MSGKGSDRRPTQVDEATFSSNWERVFGSDGVRAGAKPVSKIGNVGAIPTTPAIYVDDATGIQVSEHWWPGQPHDAP